MKTDLVGLALALIALVAAPEELCAQRTAHGGGGRGSGRAAAAPVRPGTMLGVLGGGPGVTPSPNKAAASSRCVPSGAERSRRRESSAPEKSSSAKRLQRGRMGRLMSVQSQPHTT